MSKKKQACLSAEMISVSFENCGIEVAVLARLAGEQKAHTQTIAMMRKRVIRVAPSSRRPMNFSSVKVTLALPFSSASGDTQYSVPSIR